MAPGARAGNPPRILDAWASAGPGSRRSRALPARIRLRAEFRAALHAGKVVVGELGSRKKEIALIGDPMNTAARMLDACREIDRSALASAALLDRLAGLPEGVARRPLGPLAMRGKEQAVALFALETGAAEAGAGRAAAPEARAAGRGR